MADGDLNSAEYIYEQRSEGKVGLARTLTALGYAAVGIGLFILCININPYLFAIGPLVVYILYLCTWRLVSSDVYWEFSHGVLTVGRIKVGRHGRSKRPRLELTVKDAHKAGCYEGPEQLAGAEKVYDLSESRESDKRIYILFSRGDTECALVIEATARLGNLLASFCPAAEGVKGKSFHG